MYLSHERNLACQLRAQARLQAEEPALTVPDPSAQAPKSPSQWTFSQLERLTDEAAWELQKRGIERGDRTLLLIKPGIDLVVASYALLKIGAIPIVIDPGMGLGAWLRCVKRSQPKAFIGLKKAQWIRRLFSKSFPCLRCAVTVAKPLHWIEVALDEPYPIADVGTHELAAILFTSGSTGPAKGVCYTHGQLQAQIKALGQLGFQPGQRDLPLLSAFMLLNPALGLHTVIPPMDPSRPAQLDPMKIVSVLQSWKIQTSFGSPVLWDRISRYCQAQQIELPDLRSVFIAGAPLLPRLVTQLKPILPRGEVYSPYGATEALPLTWISGTEVLEETAPKTNQGWGICVGKALEDVFIRIEGVSKYLVPNQSELAHRFPEAGPVWVCAPVVTRSYDQMPEATKRSKRLDDEGRLWHAMGDLGYLDDQKRLWLCGRQAECVHTKEGTLYTDCCEALVNQLDEVYRCALIGIDVDELSQSMVPCPRLQQALQALLGKKTHKAYPGPKALRPAMVLELKRPLKAVSRQERQQIVDQAYAQLAAKIYAAQIQYFFFHPGFPTDVRHNAKIHRLSLAQWAQGQVEASFRPSVSQDQALQFS